MHSGKRAIIDLDDTLGGLRFVIEDHMNMITGTDKKWTDWKRLDVEEIYDITNDKFLEIAGHQYLLEKSMPHSDARYGMKLLKDAGLQLTILTARSWHRRPEYMTQRWLELYDIPFDDIVVCAIEEDKADYIRHMDNVLFTIDDSPRHCNSYAQMTHNRPEYVFAYEMPWNQSGLHESVIPVKTLFEFSLHIEGL